MGVDMGVGDRCDTWCVVSPLCQVHLVISLACAPSRQGERGKHTKPVIKEVKERRQLISLLGQHARSRHLSRLQRLEIFFVRA